MQGAVGFTETVCYAADDALQLGMSYAGGARGVDGSSATIKASSPFLERQTDDRCRGEEKAMPTTRTLKIRYYAVSFNPNDGRHSPLQQMQSIHALPALDRHRDCDGGEIFLSEFQRLQNAGIPQEVWIGELQRTRRHDRVAEGDGTGIITDIQHRSGHFVSECTYFLFIPELSAVAFHQNRHGVAWTQFRKYLNAFNNPPRPIEMEAILDRQKVQQFERLRTLRKVHLSVANPQTWLVGMPTSVQDTLGGARHFSTRYMTLTLVAPGRRGALGDGIFTFINSVIRRFREHDEDVRHLEVEGYSDAEGEPKQVIDLLEEVLQDTREYNVADVTSVSEFRTMVYRFLHGSLVGMYDKLLTNIQAAV